jgi:phosphoserine phosphatase
MIAVFDFDRTLINKDSLFGFYKLMDGENRFFRLKRYILLIAAVAYKLKLFSNTSLKKIGVYLFLKGKSKSEIDLRSAEYARTHTNITDAIS